MLSSVIVGDGVGDQVSGLAIESDLVFIISQFFLALLFGKNCVALLARFSPDSMSDASHLCVLAWIPCHMKSKEEHYY